MRHTGAGLAIPDFPLAFGGLLPPAWTGPIAVHFAHRVGALVVTIVGAHDRGLHPSRRTANVRSWSRPAWLLVLLVSIQVSLGALVILTGRQPVVNTLHVAIGASVLGTSVVLALRAFRIRVHDPVAVPAVRRQLEVPDETGDHRPLDAAVAPDGSAGPDQGPRQRARRRDHRRRLLPGRHGQRRPRLAYRDVPRHGARRQRRRGDQPGRRTGHRSADGPHASASGRRRPHRLRRRTRDRGRLVHRRSRDPLGLPRTSPRCWSRSPRSCHTRSSTRR